MSNNPLHLAPTLEAIGKVSSAPATQNAQGYGFVDIEGVGVVFCSKEVIARANVTYDDVGSDVRVRYHELADGRLKASGISLVPNDARRAAEDQELADTLSALDDNLAQIDTHLAKAFAILAKRGCIVPDYEEG